MSIEYGKGTVMVVGSTGAVGSSTTLVLMESGLMGEIILVDVAKERAEGETMDLNHGAYFTLLTWVRAGDYEDYWDANMIVVTAGAGQKPDETRLGLVKRDIDTFADMIPQTTKGLNDDTVTLIVTNLVDVLSYVAWRVPDLPAERVIGSGTVLDASRFRHSLSREFNLDPANVRAYVVGEHDDNGILVWSPMSLGDVPFESYVTSRGVGDIDASRTRIGEEVRKAVCEIIERREQTNYGVARSAAAIIERILGGDNSTLIVSTLVSGEYDIDDIYMSLPCTVNQGGVHGAHEFDLSADGTAAL